MKKEIVYRIKQPTLSYNQFWAIRDSLLRWKIQLQSVKNKNNFQEKELAEIQDTLDNVMDLLPEYAMAQ